MKSKERRWQSEHDHTTAGRYLRHFPKRGVLMTKREQEVIEQLAEAAESVLETDYEKKDMKEKREVIKQTLYNGSKKLKHSVPKGKRV
jgi:hypothetical protein